MNERNVNDSSTNVNNIARTEQFEQFAIISHEIYRNPNISARAKGVHGYAMTCAPTWEFSLRGLAHMFKEGRDAIASALAELEEHGYLTRTKITQNGRITGTEWIFHKECRKNTNFLENSPRPENPDTENPDTENPTLRKNKEKKYKNQRKGPPVPLGRKTAKKVPLGPWSRKDYTNHQIRPINDKEAFNEAENSYRDAIEIAMDLSQERNHRNFIAIMVKAVKNGTEPRDAMAALQSECFLIAHESFTGEKPNHMGRALSARLKKRLGL